MADEAQAIGGAGRALRVDGVSKHYGPVVAVDGISFDLGCHELLALVGPSGCGKTTLLRSIAGLETIDRGTIVLNDVTVDAGSHHTPPEKRSIGLVFQEHALFPHLSVADNVAFGIRRRLGRGPARERVAEMLELVDLAGYQNRYPHELSGGERQRVALARALAPHPDLLLLDEPFASLDPNLRAQLRSQVVGALRATGTPAIFVTHDQTEALAIGDRVAVMRGGHIEHLDNPVTVFHAPANRFVGAFMGEASFLPITTADRVSFTALGPIDGPAAPGPDAVAMVRPDDVTFEPDPGGEAEVVAAEFRGVTWCYTIRLDGAVDGGEVVLATVSHLTPQAIGTRGRVRLTPGHRQIIIDETTPREPRP
jgi:iron(III) transport system ATP-binding protein